MWMGGKPPLGYYRKDKKIYPDEEKVKLVNSIFKKYVELKSTTLVKEWLNKQGHPISVGNLNCILRNKAYIGQVGHKGIWYPGEHQGIIPIGLFNQAKAVMNSNRINRQHYNPSKSLLAGKLYDDKGNIMSPSWSTGSQGKKYRYYVSQAVIKKEPSKIGQISKISLPKLEEFIDNWFNQFLKDKTAIYPYIKDFEINKQKDIINKLSSYTTTRSIEQVIIKRIDLSPTHIKITLHEEQVIELLNALYENREMRLLQSSKECSYTENYHIGVIDNGAKVLVGEVIKPTPHKETNLIKILAQAYKWHQDILTGRTFKEVSEREKVSEQYVRRILELSFLSPKIIRAILTGKQPADCTLKHLLSIHTPNWREQEEIFFR